MIIKETKSIPLTLISIIFILVGFKTLGLLVLSVAIFVNLFSTCVLLIILANKHTKEKMKNKIEMHKEDYLKKLIDLVMMGVLGYILYEGGNDYFLVFFIVSSLALYFTYGYIRETFNSEENKIG